MKKNKFEFVLTDANEHTLSIVSQILKRSVEEIVSSALKVQPTRASRRK